MIGLLIQLALATTVSTSAPLPDASGPRPDAPVVHHRADGVMTPYRLSDIASPQPVKFGQ